MTRHTWTTGDEAYIRATWGEVPARAIADEIGVSEEALKAHALRMGLTQTTVRRPRWSRMEDAMVRIMAQRGIDAETIGEVIGRGTRQVRDRMRRLGV